MAKGQTTNNKGNILNDPDKRKRFKTALATITHYLQAIDDQKESIKETIESISDEYGIDKKLIRKLANVMYKHNYSSLQAENRHFELLYETLIEGKLNTVVDPLDVEETENEEEELT